MALYYCTTTDLFTSEKKASLVASVDADSEMVAKKLHCDFYRIGTEKRFHFEIYPVSRSEFVNLSDSLPTFYNEYSKKAHHIFYDN